MRELLKLICKQSKHFLCLSLCMNWLMKPHRGSCSDQSFFVTKKKIAVNPESGAQDKEKQSWKETLCKNERESDSCNDDGETTPWDKKSHLTVRYSYPHLLLSFCRLLLLSSEPVKELGWWSWCCVVLMVRGEEDGDMQFNDSLLLLLHQTLYLSLTFTLTFFDASDHHQTWSLYFSLWSPLLVLSVHVPSSEVRGKILSLSLNSPPSLVFSHLLVLVVGSVIVPWTWYIKRWSQIKSLFVVTSVSSSIISTSCQSILFSKTPVFLPHHD